MVSFDFMIGVAVPTLGIVILIWTLIRICDIDWWIRNRYKNYRRRK